MELKEILSKCDHTLLAPDARTEDILRVCREGMEFHTASVCLPPSCVKEAKKFAGDGLKICTVIGFPNGYSPTASKCFEANDALENGADEIDAVVNVGFIKDGFFESGLKELIDLKKICGNRILKVIIETCLLTREEKIAACRIVSASGADFIKTSTGFSKGGATREDVALLKEYVDQRVQVKAAGGIASLEDAEAFIKLGASRLGTSRIVKIAKQMTENKQ